MALRILEAITPSTIGGAEALTVNLCKGFVDLGAEVELFCPRGRRFIRYASDRGINCTSWKTTGKVDPHTVLRLAHMMKWHPFDVIHTHLSTASLVGSIAGKLAGKPSVAHVHGLASAASYRNSTLLIAVSDSVKHHMVAQGIPADKIKVVYNGVDLMKFKPRKAEDAKSACGFDSGGPILGVFGRLSPVKGQSLALDALALLTGKHPDMKLLIVGDGDDLPHLRAQAERLGISDRVVFIGYMADITNAMSSCDIVIVPSAKEGFSLCAAESMALERPVVASRVGGLEDVVIHGETGLLFTPGEPKEAAEYITQLLEDSSLSAKMGKRGRERAGDCFDMTKQCRQTLSVLSEVAGR